MAIDSMFDNAKQAARAGELWRAKEILQGGIRTWGYNQALFERLGLILLQMGDPLEAGKYLFLSGQRQASYEGPIALFLRRFSRAGPLQLYSTFPRAARLQRRQQRHLRKVAGAHDSQRAGSGLEAPGGERKRACR